MKSKRSIRRMVYAGIMASMLLMVQVVMSGLPNIELVSLLIILFTMFDARATQGAIAAFVLLEGLIYGFGLWWFSYIYIWYILHFVVLACRPFMSPVVAALINGFFGLAFGTLTALATLVLAGPGGAVTYIIAGIPFDISHCIGNFVLALLLYKPLYKIVSVLQEKEKGWSQVVPSSE